jgi:uroporphyrinogen-III synthase
MTALRGVGVLVTRPEHQAAPLCRLLEAQGADVERLPALEIRPLDAARAQVGVGSIDTFDLALFVSANAVKFGARLLAARHPMLAAVGRATARALTDAGYPVAIVPAGADSESLLARPELQNLSGRRVLLIKGEDGRELLARELKARGAQVHAVDVYRRERVSPDAGRLAQLGRWFRDGEIRVVTATSIEIAASLLAPATAPLRADFEKATWLVASERIGRGVREYGLSAGLLQAASAQDHDLVAALLNWRSSVSGA